LRDQGRGRNRSRVTSSNFQSFYPEGYAGTRGREAAKTKKLGGKCYNFQECSRRGQPVLREGKNGEKGVGITGGRRIRREEKAGNPLSSHHPEKGGGIMLT